MTRARARSMMLCVTAAVLAPLPGAAQSVAAVPAAVAATVAPADPSAPAVGASVLGYGNAAARAAAAARVTAEAVRAPVALPLGANVGPDVLHVQILLDAARFAPGVL